MLTLRYYQSDAVIDFENFAGANHDKNPLIVIPTGGGKSLVIATIIKNVMEYDRTRVLVLTHQKELIEQNYEEFLGLVMEDGFIDCGIYSAGLKKREYEHRIIFAGIQSVHRKAYTLGYFDVILIDEAHRVPSDSEGIYRKFLADMKKINPKCMIAGLSATPYRMKGGLLCDEENKNRLFHAICHETSVIELIDPNHAKNRDQKQYLCPLISKNSIYRADLSGVSKTAGEYNLKELEQAFNKESLINSAVGEIKRLAEKRKHILVFTVGISHCEAVTEALNISGLNAECIHSKKSDIENEVIIRRFKDGKIRTLVNVDILTTGFNYKAIDCIAVLRSTESPGLYAQMAGRGLRLHPEKENCLFLDFGGNILRHGPIDKIYIRPKKKGRGDGEAPMKECPQCFEAIFSGLRICPWCEYVYPENEMKHEAEASSEAVLSSEAEIKKPITVDVKNIVYSRHEKSGKTPSLRVDYYYNDYNEYFSEWVCLEHSGFAFEKAKKWCERRVRNDVSISGTPSIEEFIENQDLFKKPTRIVVDQNDRFPRITGYIF